MMFFRSKSAGRRSQSSCPGSPGLAAQPTAPSARLLGRYPLAAHICAWPTLLYRRFLCRWRLHDSCDVLDSPTFAVVRLPKPNLTDQASKAGWIGHGERMLICILSRREPTSSTNSTPALERSRSQAQGSTAPRLLIANGYSCASACSTNKLTPKQSLNSNPFPGSVDQWKIRIAALCAGPQRP